VCAIFGRFFSRGIIFNGEGAQVLKTFSIIGLTALLLTRTVTEIPSTTETTNPIYINLETADSLWSLRADTANAKAALGVYLELTKGDSNSLDLWAKLSRAYYFQAQYLTSSAQLRDSLFMRGYAVSQTILKQNSTYRDLLFSTGDESIAVRGLGNNSIDALYWGMANYGQWLSTKSSVVRLGQREVIWTTLEHINDLDSTFFYGAYYRFKGALLRNDPETETNILGMKKAFDKAIAMAPEYLGNYTLMALHYCPQAQDKNLFYELLTKVVTSVPDPDLPYYAENVYEKSIAERLMIKAEKENWFRL